MKNILICSYSVTMFVNSTHCSRLEFVLTEAEDRKTKYVRPYRTFTTYTDALLDMIQKSLDSNSKCRVISSCEYGDISFTIEASNLEQLQKGIIIADKVIQKWINKYNIEKMKENKIVDWEED